MKLWLINTFSFIGGRRASCVALLGVWFSPVEFGGLKQRETGICMIKLESYRDKLCEGVVDNRKTAIKTLVNLFFT